MSVLIKGMEMPTNCCACPCAYDNQCAATYKYPTFDEWYEQKPDWCPLVPVPDHGRLIDADALEEYFVNDPSCLTIFEAIKKLQGMPTIIPASGGNENE